MDKIEINIGGRDFVFAVEFVDDHDAAAPWENSDCHGVVSDWESRPKRPGELVLNSDRGAKRFYDFAASCKIALRDGWDSAPYNDGSETKRQQAAKAARADYEYLRAWCNDDWRYVGIIVTLLDDDGEKTGVSESLWCVETFNDFHESEAWTMADELAHGYGVSWGEVEKKTFGFWKA